MRFFTSDLHFGHNNIIGFCARPFNNVPEMNETLINNINKTVSPKDHLYILGDFSFYPSDNNVAIVKSIHCPVTLIRGNHDYKNRIKNVGFAEVHNELDIELGNQVVTLSHFPYRGDNTPTDRFPELRPKDVGLWLLHGHTHDKAQINREQRMFHVGCDAWNYLPISEDVIIKLIQDKE